MHRKRNVGARLSEQDPSGRSDLQEWHNEPWTTVNICHDPVANPSVAITAGNSVLLLDSRVKLAELVAKCSLQDRQPVFYWFTLKRQTC